MLGRHEHSTSNMTVKILVVEDEEPLALLLKYNLEAEDFQVRIAYRGEEAEIAVSLSGIDDCTKSFVIAYVGKSGKQ